MNQDHKFRRAPIASPEAEQSVLGAILIQPQYLAEIAAIVSPDSFYWESHSLIFRAMLDLEEQGEPVDLVTVTLLLKERNQLERVGGPVFLSSLSEQVGFAVNGPHYARRVQEKYLVRKLATRAREIFDSCARFNGNGNVAELYLFAESQIQDSINGLGFSEPAVITGQQLLSKDFSQLPPVLGGGLYRKVAI